MSVYVLCVNSIMFILSICSIPLTLCFVFVFILFSVLPYDEIKSCITMAVSLTVYEIFSVKEERDLENWVTGCSKH